MRLRSDARHLPYRSGSFDFVFTSPPWDNLGVLEEARPEMERVLSKRGRMALLLPNEDANLASLVLTNRDWTERQSLACEKPRTIRGYRYYSPSEDFVARVLKLHAPDNARVLDPFCGTGTIPNVAGRMGFFAVGSDIA